MKRGRPRKITEEKELKEYGLDQNIPNVTSQKIDEPIELKNDESTKQGDYNVEIIRDYGTNLDPFYIPKKNPDFEYRYLRSDEKNLSIKTGNLLFNKGGWQLCPREHLLKIGFKVRELAPDGFRRVNDTVLSFMPKKLYEEKWAVKVKAAKFPMDIINRNIEKGNPELDGKIHPSMKGLQTEEALRMN